MTVHRNTVLLGLFIALVAMSLACSGDKSSSAAAAPDEAVLQVASGLADGKPDVAWRALPPSYRKDVTELVHLAATKMDADVWNQSFAVLQKVTQLARDKRQFILDQPMLAQAQSDRKELEAGWDALVGIFEVVVQSDLADLQKLEKLNIERFLAGTGGDLMERIEAAAALSPDDSFAEQMRDLKRTKATVVSNSGDSAVVRVERPGTAPLEQNYVQIEGHWVPEKLAADWDTEIDKARRQLEQISTEYMAENKASVLMQLSMVEGAVDSLLQAEDAQQFNAALGPIMGMAMSAAMAQAQSAPSISLGSSPPSGFDAGVDPEMQGAMQQAMDEAMQQAIQEAQAQGLDVRFDGSPGSLENAAPGMRDTRHTFVADASAPELHQPGEVRLDQAHRYIGQLVHVTTGDGLDAMCRLKEARTDAIVFERNMYGGSVSFEIAHHEIESLRVVDR